jgi:hypothetical protein
MEPKHKELLGYSVFYRGKKAEVCGFDQNRIQIIIDDRATYWVDPSEVEIPDPPPEDVPLPARIPK